MLTIEYASTIEICLKSDDIVYYILYDEASKDWDVYVRSPLCKRIMTLKTSEECLAWLFNHYKVMLALVGKIDDLT